MHFCFSIRRVKNHLSLSYYKKKTYLFHFSCENSSLLYSFIPLFGSTPYLGNVKHQSKKYRVQTTQSNRKTGSKKEILRQAFYCIQHAMCSKYLMNLKEKNHNPHVLSVLLPTGELQGGWERAPQQPAWSSGFRRAGQWQINHHWAAFPCAMQQDMEQKPLWRVGRAL